MKTIGIVGGLAPVSTVEYYQSIISKFQLKYGTEKFPRIVIDSVDIKKMLHDLNNQNYKGVIDYLSEAVENIAKAGANFGILASNTPHIVFNEIQAKSPIPLLSIVEETFKAVKTKNITKIGLLGTKFTMEADFYKKVFIDNGISVYVPDEIDQQFLQQKIFGELEYGILNDDTKRKFLEIIQKLKGNHNIEGVILGCTELPLIIKDEDEQIPLFNTTEIHVDSVIQYLDE